MERIEQNLWVIFFGPLTSFHLSIDAIDVVYVLSLVDVDDDVVAVAVAVVVAVVVVVVVVVKVVVEVVVVAGVHGDGWGGDVAAATIISVWWAWENVSVSKYTKNKNETYNLSHFQ